MFTKRSMLAVCLSLLMVAGLAPSAGASGSMLQTDCNNPPSVMAISDVRAGMTGKAYTALSGRTISEFDVEVVGVLPGAIYPLIDMVLIKVSGPAVDAVDGIAAGFSGSPVYVDGKLLGAIAYGFWGNSYIGGVTPAESMVDIASLPATSLSRLNARAERALSTIESSVGELGTPRPLPVPVAVGGVSPQRIAKLQAEVDAAGLPLKVYRAAGSTQSGSGGGSPGMIMPGESLSAVLSEGDAFAFGTGTATYCDGATVVGWGHPFFWTGTITMSMNEADVVTVIEDTSGFFNFKIATLGEPAGRLDFDGNAGIRGISGQAAPSVPITSSVEFAGHGATRQGTTNAFVTKDIFFSLGWTSAWHLLTNLDYVSGTGFRPGSSLVEWTVNGTRQDGTPFTASFDNRYWDSFSITDASVFELAGFVDQLLFNPFERVTVNSVDVGRAELFTDRRTIDITKTQASTTSNPDPVSDFGFLRAMPGDTVTVDVTLRAFAGEESVETFALQIPEDFVGGFGSLSIHGGRLDEFYYDPFNPESATGDVQNFDDLLDELMGRDHNYDLVAELTLFESYAEGVAIPQNGTGEPPDGPVPSNGFSGDQNIVRVKEVREFDKVVRGDRFLDLEVLPESPPVFGTLFADLSGDNEVGGGDPDGTGTAELNFEGDQLMFDITLEAVAEPITGAHIHTGVDGENGPVVVDLEFETNGLSGVVSADPAIFGEMLAYPEQFYVNVHSDAYPDGAVRGQLSLELTGGGGGGSESSLGFVSGGGLWTLPGYDPFYFGNPGDIPFVGDWDGDGVKTPGLYRPASGFAYTRNSNDTGVADNSFYLGVGGDIPLVGDWDGDGVDTFGVYRSSEAKVYLRNSNTTGVADVEYHFGRVGDVPFAGDFDGNGVTDIGVHRNGRVFLRLSHSAGPADLEFSWGIDGDRVLAGDWNHDGFDTVGLVRASSGMFYLRNANSSGVAEGEMSLGSTAWVIVS
ncbi:MAG: CHRD domain-containing protein [Acidimicrobiia bacterium]|nr:CHRD domain-containing protein [Acidimicrobiia bacterium]